MKKLLSMILALAIIICAVPLGVFTLTASAETYNENGYNYTISNGDATITGVDTSISGDVTIPDTLGGYQVVTIGDRAFTSKTKITSITIPDSVVSIDNYCFYGCSDLAQINVDENNQKYCSADGVLFNKDKTSLVRYPQNKANTSYDIPDSVKRVSSYAFYGSKNLTSITISDNAENIGMCAFMCCYNLINVTIPDSVTALGNSSFARCSSLESIKLGRNLAYLDECVFSGCDALKEIIVDENNNSYCAVDNVLFNKDKTILIQYAVDKANTTYTIPDGVIGICDQAFSGCTSLKSIAFPNSVTKIGFFAFYDSDSLENVYITDISAWWNIDFYDNWSNPLCYADNLYLNGEIISGDFVIPEGVEKIPDFAFENSKITSITIPDGITSIGSYAFYNCTSLASVYISDSITSIGSYAFYNCTSLASVYISDSVTSIGDNAFENCTNLASITIPDGITSIDGYIFSGCTSLTNITIPDSVTGIGGYAFSNCTSLASVYIPDSITYISEGAFQNCESLTGVYITDISAWCNIDFTRYSDSNPLKYAKNLYLNGELVTDLVIPEGITSISENSFYNCTSITSVTIPDSVTSIGWLAFEGCENLENVYITDIATWCNIEFSDNPLYYADNLYLNGELVTDVVIPDGVTKIPYRAFSSSSITSVTIPDSVTSIGDYAFYGCSRLTSITIPDSVTNIGGGTFGDCDNLTHITIPDGVTSIGYYTFYNCINLTSITIPDSVTFIGSRAFYNCKSLTSITIPDSVTFIGNHAFYNCKSLTSITIPDSVTFIDEYAFENCDGFTNVTIGDSVTSIGYCAFFSCSSLTSITIPDSVTSIGFSAFFNCYNLQNVWYTGSENDKQNIYIRRDNEDLINAIWHYNTCDDEHTYDNACDDDCNNCEWTREVPGHIYNNACDEDCNACGEKRNKLTHSYDECFADVQQKFYGEWQIAPSKTGIYAINPTNWQGEFSNHFIAVFDQKSNAVKYNEMKQGWPLIAGQNYTISIRYSEDEYEINTNWSLEQTYSKIFPDTSSSGWYIDAVTYAVGAGIMKGYASNGKFGTEDNLQRQDFIVMLANYEGINEADYNYKSTLRDVNSSGYYKAAVNWAIEAGITTGYQNGKFGVGDNITREQIVTFLYRYAKYKGINVEVDPAEKAQIAAQYKDFAKVSSFSQKEVVWAIANKAISGMDATTINPQGNASRAQIAQIMYNIFLNDIF